MARSLHLPRAMIIVGTDFSQPSKAALEYASRLRSRLGLKLELVHVVERQIDPEVGRDPTSWSADPAATQWLSTAGVDPKTLVTRQGVPWVQLARRAEECGASLLVVGSHGRAGYQPLGLGSTAARLAVLAPCPVVVVGPRCAGSEEQRPEPQRSRDAIRPRDVDVREGDGRATNPG
jgi:nucleotide-binding universal stress UspA family protein